MTIRGINELSGKGFVILKRNLNLFALLSLFVAKNEDIVVGRHSEWINFWIRFFFCMKNQYSYSSFGITGG